MISICNFFTLYYNSSRYWYQLANYKYGLKIQERSVLNKYWRVLIDTLFSTPLTNSYSTLHSGTCWNRTWNWTRLRKGGKSHISFHLTLKEKKTFCWNDLTIFFITCLKVIIQSDMRRLPLIVECESRSCRILRKLAHHGRWKFFTHRDLTVLYLPFLGSWISKYPELKS